MPYQQSKVHDVSKSNKPANQTVARKGASVLIEHPLEEASTETSELSRAAK